MPNAEEPDLAAMLARARQPDLPWEQLYVGVDIHRVWGTVDGASGALLRYAPGSRVPPHRHEGVENVYVLSGAQRDDRGVYEAGAHVVNPPGSSHAVWSPDGCIVYVVWERPNKWLEP
jgi:anti-sigma factor ChrR (cupin superfamily)